MKKALIVFILVFSTAFAFAGKLNYISVGAVAKAEDLKYFDSRSFMVNAGAEGRIGSLINGSIPLYGGLNSFYSKNVKNAQLFSQIPDSFTGSVFVGSGYKSNNFSLLAELGFKFINFGFNRVNLFSLAEITIVPEYSFGKIAVNVPFGFAFGKNGKSLSAGIGIACRFGDAK